MMDIEVLKERERRKGAKEIQREKMQLLRANGRIKAFNVPLGSSFRWMLTVHKGSCDPKLRLANSFIFKSNCLIITKY